jgi:hypothetical protein
MTSVTALAPVDLCNMGLSYLGISTQIQSITPPDGTEQAKVCAFWYDKCRQELLQIAPWSFAYTSVILASDASLAGASGTIGSTYAFPGWRYAYQYPNDCLQAIAVTTYAGLRLGPAFWSNWWWPVSGMTYAIPKIPYKIVQSVANPGQQMILCDLPSSATSPVYLFYIQNVTNTQQFTPLFNNGLAFDIGYRAGLTMRSANLQKVQFCQAAAKTARLEALAQALNEFQQDQERDSPSVMARW